MFLPSVPTASDSRTAKLLRHWAKLEPLRCASNIDGTFRVILDNSGSWSINPAALEKLPILALKESQDHHQAILQLALQQAIASSGWSLNLTRGNCWLAWIEVAELENAVDGGLQTEPAIALLSAYIQALEATQQTGGGSTWQP